MSVPISMKKIITIISLLLSLPLLYLLISVLFLAKKIKYQEEPLFYRSQFSNSSGLEHFESVTKDADQVYSTYFYKKDYAIVVFRQKTSMRNLKNTVEVIDKKNRLSAYQGYTGIISEKINYRLNDEIIDSLSLNIKNSASIHLKEELEKAFYVQIYLNDNISIDFNNDGVVDFLASSYDVNQEEYNELLIKKEEEYLYFIYLKPLKPIGNPEKDILRKLVNF